MIQWSVIQKRAQSSNWTRDERETCDCQEVGEYKTEVKYSYYTILILDTVQPMVNSSQRIESYRKSQKLMEGTTSFYVILVWFRMCVITEVGGSS